jgi:hypothetical protein
MLNAIKKNTHTYTHTHREREREIRQIHNCDTNTVGSGTSHKYTNICNFCSAKYKSFTKSGIINHINTYEIHVESKRSMLFRYYLKAALHFVL